MLAMLRRSGVGTRGVELLLEDCASNGVRGDSRSDRRCVRAMIQLGGMGQSVIAISH